jgi:hypothetical protein
VFSLFEVNLRDFDEGVRMSWVNKSLVSDIENLFSFPREGFILWDYFVEDYLESWWDDGGWY